MLESMEIVRRFSLSHITISYKIILELTILHSVATVSSFFPFTAFLATLLFYTSMNAKLEFTAIKVIGISAMQILSCLLIVVSLIGIFYITVIDSFSAFSVDKIKRIESRIGNKNLNEDITITNSGIWFKDKSKKKSYIIYAKAFSEDSHSLSNIRFFEFDENQIFKSSTYAKAATIENGVWNVKNAKTIDVHGEEKNISNFKIPTVLSFSGIDKMTTNPKSISFWSMSKYVSMLEKVGLSSTRYKVQWFFQLSSILQMIALVMLASIFCAHYNSRNTRKYAIKIAAVLTLAFPIHFMNNILMALGSTGAIPIFVAAFIMPISTIVVCYFNLVRK